MWTLFPRTLRIWQSLHRCPDVPDLVLRASSTRVAVVWVLHLVHTQPVF